MTNSEPNTCTKCGRESTSLQGHLTSTGYEWLCDECEDKRPDVLSDSDGQV